MAVRLGPYRTAKLLSGRIPVRGGEEDAGASKVHGPADVVPVVC